MMKTEIEPAISNQYITLNLMLLSKLHLHIHLYIINRSDELVLKTGDVVGIAGNHWDGYSKGVNRRTRQNGLYPSYKMEEVVDIADFPSYAEVDKRSKT